jgi:16S rRNA (guanine527-N7)-methyltransferase
MTADFQKYLIENARRMDMEISAAQAGAFESYADLLTEWNEKMNLTAITEPKEIAVKHFLDSLSGAALLPRGARVIDVGAGAGFPSLPLKIFRGDLSVFLLDSLRKRVGFLERVVGALGLREVSALHARAEDAARLSGLREGFSAAVSRAVARLDVLAEYCLPFVKVGGIFIAYKGPDAAEEAEEAKEKIFLLGGKLAEIRRVALPDFQIEHTLFVIEKQRPTPKAYPRSAHKIAKRPAARQFAGEVRENNAARVQNFLESKKQ